MGYRVVSVILLLAIVSVFGEQAENTTTKVDVTPQKSARNLIYAELISCAVRYDTACFVNVAQDFLEIRRNELLAQADEEALRATGRADPENKPSHLAKMIEKLISDLTSMFKDNFSEYFSAKENDDELEENEKDVDTNKTSNDVGTSRSSQGGSSHKKKKGKHQLIRRIAIAAAIFAILCLLLKLVQTALLFKLVLLGAAILGVSILKLIALWKSAKQKTIYYENSHHDHHYDHEDIWGHEDWGRNDDAQNMAYVKQKPSQPW